MKSLYAILGVPSDATSSEIKKAYRKLASKYHPDKGNEGSAEEMALINGAYEVLGDRDKRQRYDETGNIDNPPSAREKAIMLINSRLAALMENNNFAPDNYFKLFRKELEQNIRSMAQQKVQLKDYVEKINYLLKHTKVKNSDLLIGLNDKLAKVENLLSQIKEQEPLYEVVKNVLDECEYTGEVPEAKPLFSTGTSNINVSPYARSGGFDFNGAV